MLDTSARLLRLLSLLQARRDWSGPALAERLGVGARTVRRDVERLRSLGYPVHATPGVSGGYRLGVGAALPPLLLDDDEAVAVAVGLRSAAAGGGVAGIEETSVRALTKLEQVLPSRLRRRVNAVHDYTVTMPGTGPTVDVGVLTTVTAACRDHERLRFDYTVHDGSGSVRTVEPHRLVSWGRRWYLVAWDLDRQDWRIFRADRISPRTPAGPRFAPRDPPEGDVVAYVSHRMGTAMWPYQARVRVHAPAESIADRITGLLEAIDEHSCMLTVAGDSLGVITVFLSMIDADFDVIEPPELVEHVARLADRYHRAAHPPTPGA
ncbi:Predicted DNA-binding transcriptional regulator YafY, contains an HTH and WYL domains [Streptosporangium subroseum]|uniref:Predicted DNA-binding transcriptional regulator YafY, contains an HTH and WYL domains n=1 Tax=Streptosporangium subroseum TaxID=106412 RepID=A0A239EW24_9ACTN|nr:YafY family protein [Streptosporangium subroseum]SNS48876.1 Predicted DNA-binding transcriptional regulator YafY, contains an HTH and WYL domains [Streptosporangium subroseum]